MLYRKENDSNKILQNSCACYRNVPLIEYQGLFSLGYGWRLNKFS